MATLGAVPSTESNYSGINIHRLIATANGVSNVTVSDPNLSITDDISISLNTVGGTVGSPYVTTITANSGFTFASSASDTSIYNITITRSKP